MLVLLGVAIIGLISLYFYIQTIPIEEVSISEISPSHAGKVIRTRGYVKDVHRLSGGNILLNLTDMKKGIDVFIPAKVVSVMDVNASVPGAYLSVTGEVTIYNNKIEIMLEKPSDITVVSPPGGTDFPLKTIVTIPEQMEGMRLTTHGSVSFIKETTGNLTVKCIEPNNTSLEILIIVKKSINETIIYRDVVDVYGEFTFGYEFQSGWRIVVYKPEHGISKHPIPNASTPVTLGEVLIHPEKFSNMSIHLKGLLVVRAQTLLGSGFRLTDDSVSITCFIYWYPWRSDIRENDMVRFTGILQYYPPSAAWRIVSESPEDIVRLP